MSDLNDTQRDENQARYFISYSEVSTDVNGNKNVERPYPVGSMSGREGDSVAWRLRPEKLDRNNVWYLMDNKQHPDYKPQQVQLSSEGRPLPTHRLMFQEQQENGRYGAEMEAATVWPRQDKSSLMQWKISPDTLGEGKYKVVENERQQHRTTEQEQNSQTHQAQDSQQARDAFDQIDTRKAQTQERSQGLER